MWNLLLAQKFFWCSFNVLSLIEHKMGEIMEASMKPRKSFPLSLRLGARHYLKTLELASQTCVPWLILFVSYLRAPLLGPCVAHGHSHWD